LQQVPGDFPEQSECADYGLCLILGFLGSEGAWQAKPLKTPVLLKRYHGKRGGIVSGFS
jgi:hypothetical protein